MIIFKYFIRLVIGFYFCSLPLRSMDDNRFVNCSKIVFSKDNTYYIYNHAKISVDSACIGAKILDDTRVRDVFSNLDVVAIVKEIISSFVLQNEKIKFESYDGLINEIKFRLHMIADFPRFIHKAEFNNDDNDAFILPMKYWVANGAYVLSENGELVHHEHGSYIPRSSFSSHEAISSCENADLVLDCSGAAMAIAYFSLSKVLSVSQFNEFFTGSRVLSLSTFAVSFPDEKTGDFRENIIFHENILAEKIVTQLQELTPGDIVYFANHPEYEEIAPRGNSYGEYAIYTGLINDKSMFIGHGITKSSYSEIIHVLEKAFQKSLGKLQGKRPKRLKGTKKSARSLDNDFLDATYPSMSTTVYKIGAFQVGGVFSKQNRQPGPKA